ncbi:MAG: hypothetical protein R3B07_21770 [Polyangiaceae bacterium]
MSEAFEFATLKLKLPATWRDGTQDGEDLPPTLVREQGVGSLQFSVARYASGEAPNMTLADLRELLSARIARHGLQSKALTEHSRATRMSVRGRCWDSDVACSLWMLSNGSDIAFVSYVFIREDGEPSAEELSEAEAIVNSIEF